MLHEFLETHRDQLIERCRTRVAARAAPKSVPQAMEYGIPQFLGHLIDTLRQERFDTPSEAAWAVAQASPPVRKSATSTAAKHGHELLRDGYAIDQVVYDYGDVCQAITELAVERGETVSARDFHTLNRCLDDAIADAVSEFGWQRDQLVAQVSTRVMSERMGFLAHELRNSLNTAILSFAVIKTGKVAVSGATSSILDRSLMRLRELIDRALAEVQDAAGPPVPHRDFALAPFIAEVQVAAALESAARMCEFVVAPVEPGINLRTDRSMFFSAVSNLLQNAFKFTHRRSRVTLTARAEAGRVLIEVEDCCGGLAPGKAEAMFVTFQQLDKDRTGLGLGLSIARQAVEAGGGTLDVRDIPGKGCIFTIELPRHERKAATTATPAPALEAPRG